MFKHVSRFFAALLAAIFVLTGLQATLVAATPSSGPTTVSAAPVKLSKAQLAAKVKKDTLRKYGVYPLPVKVKSITRYKLRKTHLRQIVKSKKWAKTRKARSVVRCESGGNYKINTGNGYYGAWQFDFGTWRANGGGKFGRTANRAPKFAQDYVAWKTWKARGWQPWACA